MISFLLSDKGPRSPRGEGGLPGQWHASIRVKWSLSTNESQVSPPPLGDRRDQTGGRPRFEAGGDFFTKNPTLFDFFITNYETLTNAQKAHCFIHNHFIAKYSLDSRSLESVLSLAQQELEMETEREKKVRLGDILIIIGVNRKCWIRHFTAEDEMTYFYTEHFFSIHFHSVFVVRWGQKDYKMDGFVQLIPIN